MMHRPESKENAQGMRGVNYVDEYGEEEEDEEPRAIETMSPTTVTYVSSAWVAEYLVGCSRTGCGNGQNPGHPRRKPKQS